jgi:hypothetical protein
MERIYTNNGQGISTKIDCLKNGKKYIISTAQDPRGPWQLAIFQILFDIPHIYGKVDQANPYVGPISETFKEAEILHQKVEKIVSEQLPETWLITMHSW